jgi:hypothetical protein
MTTNTRGTSLFKQEKKRMQKPSTHRERKEHRELHYQYGDVDDQKKGFGDNGKSPRWSVVKNG